MSEEAKTHVHVIKRNGEEVTFDLSKIENAIKAANNEVDKLHQLNEYQVHAIADNLEKQIESMSHAVHVEDIQDMVETGIMEMRGYKVAQKYVRYRYKREYIKHIVIILITSPVAAIIYLSKPLLSDIFVVLS